MLRYLITSLPRYLITSLPHSFITSLLAYFITLLPYYLVTSLLHYLITLLLRHLKTDVVHRWFYRVLGVLVCMYLISRRIIFCKFTKIFEKVKTIYCNFAYTFKHINKITIKTKNYEHRKQNIRPYFQR